ncbi:MAG: IS66 family transposase, partial [Gammaproteobacteria bacterium]|nr:IS66 family transposase [Gammaproteobacteria bacterium]
MKSQDSLTGNQQDKADYLLSEQIALLLEKDQLIGEQAVVIERKSEVISAQKQRILILEEALRLSKIKRFAPSSEQCHQYSLFDEAEVEAETDNDLAELDAEETGETAEKKKKTGRKPFSDKLPREQIFIRLTDEEKAGAVDTFFSKVKEELDIIPAKVRILEYMQEKAVFVEQ